MLITSGHVFKRNKFVVEQQCADASCPFLPSPRDDHFQSVVSLLSFSCFRFVLVPAFFLFSSRFPFPFNACFLVRNIVLNEIKTPVLLRTIPFLEGSTDRETVLWTAQGWVLQKQDHTKNTPPPVLYGKALLQFSISRRRNNPSPPNKKEAPYGTSLNQHLFAQAFGRLFRRTSHRSPYDTQKLTAAPTAASTAVLSNSPLLTCSSTTSSVPPAVAARALPFGGR